MVLNYMDIEQYIDTWVYTGPETPDILNIPERHPETS